MESIRSTSNPALKRVRAVAAGREPGIVLLEGDRLIDEALRLGLGFELMLVAEDRPERAAELEAAGVAVRRVSAPLLQGVSRLVTSPGVLALVGAPDTLPIRALAPSPDALVVVAAGIADPGNLGALARTAEAAGARALVALGDGASPWNEKALRGSMGSLLRLPIAMVERAEQASEELSALGFRQVRAVVRGGVDHRSFDWSGPLALWLASETGALPDAAQGFEGVSVPMAGPVESLNVTAAAAVLLFAAQAERTSRENA
ncbi:MAG: RNA methyltransferase [Planctomycetota bacterium]|nr:RNA methyltransferase [Planctomycetota bacterium]